MTNTTRSTDSYTPPKDPHTSGSGVRLVDPSTPGYLYRGCYTMVFACSPGLCSCTNSSPARAFRDATLRDVVVSDGLDVPLFDLDPSGVRPVFDVPSGEMFLAAGPDEANDVIVNWEWDLVYDLVHEVLAVPASGRMFAVGRPGMDQFVLGYVY